MQYLYSSKKVVCDHALSICVCNSRKGPYYARLLTAQVIHEVQPLLGYFQGLDFSSRKVSMCFISTKIITDLTSD